MDIDVIVKKVTQFEQRIVALEQMASPVTASPTQPDVISDILSRLDAIETTLTAKKP